MSTHKISRRAMRNLTKNAERNTAARHRIEKDQRQKKTDIIMHKYAKRRIDNGRRHIQPYKDTQRE